MFSYAWHIDDDEPDVTAIRIYGLNEKNENVCVRIDNFTPYIYLELPTNVEWTESLASLLGSKIDFLMGQKKPLVKCLIRRKKLYYAHRDARKKEKKFPYLFCSFSHPGDIKILGYKIRKDIRVTGLGSVRLKMHEHNASPILQLASQRKLPTAGWIEFVGKKVETDAQKTRCDHEYTVRWKNTKPAPERPPAKPLIMGFDIEVNSSNPARMPDATKPPDKVFQISCILSRQGDPPEKYDKYLLTLGQPDFDILGDDVGVLMYDNEAELLQGFTDFVNEHNPNILVGYNILGFDIPYMIDRAKHNLCIYDFDRMGFLKGAHARETTINWSSSAYKNQSFQFLDAEGRLFVDLLPLVKRDYKLNNYKLKTVASQFLKGLTKDDLSPQGIFKCYRIGMRGGRKGEKAMGVVGKYCVKDSLLMNMLFEKLQTWIGLTEMASVCNVPVFYLYTKGQQIKVFSQLYKKCTHENRTVEKDGYVPKDDEHYVGATVFPPVPGVYDRVVPFDFSSLYPTTIIAYNLDYSTLVEDEKIPDSECHVMEWEDHIGCIHDPKVVRKTELTQYINQEMKNLTKLRDTKKGKKGRELEEIKQEVAMRVKALKPYREERSELNKSKPKHIMCTPRKFRWLKEPLGVLPTLLKDLLEARSHTKKEIKVLKKKLKEEKMTDEERVSLETALTVLDKRQLAYKVSANSGYGATGVQRGFLPMMPVAMCTTYMGRESIGIVADVIPRKFKGTLVYGDTDSNYIAFPHLADKTAAEIWDYSEYVAAEVTKLFPPPMNLAFEEVIYWRFFILTKKRYMSLACYRDGVVSDDIKKKGVLLARRDNCQFIRDVYGAVILKVFHRESREHVVNFVLDELNKLCSGFYPHEKFIMTQAIGSSGGLQVVPFINEKGKKKGMVGDYTVPLLPEDESGKEHKMKLKKAVNARQYYLRCLPAQVQLAEKMRRRGQRVEPGTRLEYVVTNQNGHKAKKYENIESSTYYKKHSDALKIDYWYYLRQLTNHLDQVLNVMYAKDDSNYQKNMVLEQYKYRVRVRGKMIASIKKIFQPTLQFAK
jgi:DNA polymerase elongation subunit (family B)